ncbi:unnamed protein product, partial [Ectocarpus sp. 8 AP-2014]
MESSWNVHGEFLERSWRVLGKFLGVHECLQSTRGTPRPLRVAVGVPNLITLRQHMQFPTAKMKGPVTTFQDKNSWLVETCSGLKRRPSAVLNAQRYTVRPHTTCRTQCLPNRKPRVTWGFSSNAVMGIASPLPYNRPPPLRTYSADIPTPTRHGRLQTLGYCVAFFLVSPASDKTSRVIFSRPRESSETTPAYMGNPNVRWKSRARNMMKPLTVSQRGASLEVLADLHRVLVVGAL